MISLSLAPKLGLGAYNFEALLRDNGVDSQVWNREAELRLKVFPSGVWERGEWTPITDEERETLLKKKLKL